MVIRTPEDIDFSTFPESDGQPMAETTANVIQMLDLWWTLGQLFKAQGRDGVTTVGANQFVYYNRFNGRDNISPDVYVIFDRPPPAPPSWKTWIEGKFPDVVFEITSPSTQANDLSTEWGVSANSTRGWVPRNITSMVPAQRVRDATRRPAAAG